MLTRKKIREKFWFHKIYKKKNFILKTRECLRHMYIFGVYLRVIDHWTKKWEKKMKSNHILVSTISVELTVMSNVAVFGINDGVAIDVCSQKMFLNSLCKQDGEKKFSLLSNSWKTNYLSEQSCTNNRLAINLKSFIQKFLFICSF